MRSAARVVVVGALVLVTGVGSRAFAAEAASEPNMLHGVAQVVGGLLVEWPKTVLDATFTNPPVVGTAIGLVGGMVKALQMTFGGLIEINQAFKPIEHS